MDVGKDGTFGTFAEDERGRKRDLFAESKRGVIFSKDSKHSMEQLESLGSTTAQKLKGANVPLRRCNLGRF